MCTAPIRRWSGRPGRRRGLEGEPAAEGAATVWTFPAEYDARLPGVMAGLREKVAAAGTAVPMTATGPLTARCQTRGR